MENNKLERDTRDVYKTLSNIYSEILTMHAEKFPYTRFGQLMSNFNFWLGNEKNMDLFYVPDEKLLEYFKEFVREFSSKW